MKFVASYSGGKDSTFAIYKAIEQGHTPILLMTMFNNDRDKSYFHGINEEILNRVSDSIGVPSLLVKTKDEEYTKKFEEALKYAKEQGAEACVFGDIDIDGHRLWCTQRCENVGLTPLFPLWGEDRKKIVYEVIDKGFVANIIVVNTNYLNASYLGKQLSTEVASDIEADGADVCGENGEYHTFVSAGPIFKQSVLFSFGESLTKDEYVILPMESIKC